jgi:hypothetical protein
LRILIFEVIVMSKGARRREFIMSGRFVVSSQHPPEDSRLLDPAAPLMADLQTQTRANTDELKPRRWWQRILFG